MFLNNCEKTETNKMYFIAKFCCVCMNTSDLKHVFDVDNGGLSHYYKLTSSITEMDFEEMNDQRLICEGCCVILNTVYAFRQACLRSKTNLVTYISQLRTYSHVNGTLSVRLKDIKHEMTEVKGKMKIKCENEDGCNGFEENELQREFHAVNFEENLNFSAIKQECDGKEDGGFTREETSADHADGRKHSDVKVEDIGHRTMKKDERCTEIDIKEHRVDVKEEAMSDSDTPQDSSTSKADGITFEETKRSVKTVFRAGQKAGRVPHKCEMCGKCFINKNDFTRHSRIHSGERPYQCEICNKSFNQKGNLTKHSLLHSGERSYECEVCKKHFTQNSNLTQHLLLHSGERPYECEICKKNFNQNSNLTRHLLMHSGERSYECEICNKRFVHKNNLSTHMLIHSGERSYECEICQKSFTRNGSLTKHMRIHSGERPYECEICKKRFTRKGSLTKHMRIHSGERPYECDVCKKSFIQRHHLNAHTHAGEIKYKCEIKDI